MWRGLLRFDVIHIALLHMIVVFTPPGWLNASMMASMTIRILIRQVEVSAVLRGAVVCRACLTVPLI